MRYPTPLPVLAVLIIPFSSMVLVCTFGSSIALLLRTIACSLLYNSSYNFVITSFVVAYGIKILF